VRDWNFKSSWNFSAWTLVWIEPVRDWNYKLTPIFSSSSFVWIEPVRDWNLCITRSPQSQWPVWIEPVRDWNEPFKNNKSPRRLCLNRTCEGLKQFFWNKIKKCIVQFESNLWGIETRNLSRGKNKSVIVWIEPVRDWNSWNFSAWTFASSVWIEPVRDWNKICLMI